MRLEALEANRKERKEEGRRRGGRKKKKQVQGRVEWGGVGGFE